jgi:hypothetical protein
MWDRKLEVTRGSEQNSCILFSFYIGFNLYGTVSIVWLHFILFC